MITYRHVTPVDPVAGVVQLKIGLGKCARYRLLGISFLCLTGGAEAVWMSVGPLVGGCPYFVPAGISQGANPTRFTCIINGAPPTDSGALGVNQFTNQAALPHIWWEQDILVVIDTDTGGTATITQVRYCIEDDNLCDG